MTSYKNIKRHCFMLIKMKDITLFNKNDDGNRS